MLWLVYFTVVSIHLFSILNEQTLWVMISKALLMPCLLLIIYFHSKFSSKADKVLFLAILFGWFGDILLMYDSLISFALGFFSFFIGHMAYIYLFSKDVSRRRQTHYIMERPYLILPFIAIIIFSITSLWGTTHPYPGLPIYLYAFTIALMSVFALNRKHAASQSSWIIVVIGTLLFIISDYLLSYKLFTANFPYDSVIVMITYTCAQGLIVYGFLRNKAI